MTSASRSAVGEETIAAFRHDGAAVLPGALTADELAAFEAAWRWSIDHPGPLASPLTPGSADAKQDLCNPNALAVYGDPLQSSSVGEIAAQLMGCRDVWFMYEQVFHKWAGTSGATPWHQDTSYLAVNGSNLLVMWISFDSVPRAQALEFVCASHLGPLYNTSRFDPGDPTLPIFESDTLPRLPDIDSRRGDYEILAWDTKPGDVVVFHPSTLHGGAPTTPAAPERRTLTLRFFGEDACFDERPGPAGPYHQDIAPHLVPGAPFRHERFLKLR